MRSYHLSLSFGEADEYTPGILVTRFAPLLHNRASQQLGQLSTPLGAGPPPFIFFHLLTVAPSSVFLLVLPRCSPPWFRNMSLMPVCTVRPVYSLVSFFPFSSPSLSILTPPLLAALLVTILSDLSISTKLRLCLRCTSPALSIRHSLFFNLPSLPTRFLLPFSRCRDTF